MLDHALGVRYIGPPDRVTRQRPEKWAAFEVAMVVPRQNGKGSILEARELAGLFLFHEKLILHTSHEFKTSADHFRRMCNLIEASPTLDSHIGKITGSHGDEGIELKTKHRVNGGPCPDCQGQRLKFIARTGGSGRGFYADLVVLDEAYNLTPAAMSALVPTLTTSTDPQVWYASSSVNQEIHPNGHVLARVRRRGMAGGDPKLCYLEWSVDEDLYNAHPDKIINNPRYWAISNPALGTERLTMEYISNELSALSTQGFAVERLGVGDWPAEDAGEQTIPADIWNRLVARPASVDPPLVFSIDVPPNRSSASFASCRYLPTGVKFVEVLRKPEDAPRGIGWAIAEAKRLDARWHPSCWVIDRLGPASTLVDALVEAGLPVQVTDGTEMAVACGAFYDDAMSAQLRHGAQRPLDMALRAATTRKLLDRWAWNRVGLTDISPLVAVTLARYGLTKYGRPKVIASPIVETVAAGSGSFTDDLALANF